MILVGVTIVVMVIWITMVVIVSHHCLMVNLRSGMVFGDKGVVMVQRR